MTYEEIGRLRYDRDLILKVSILTQEQIYILLKIYDKLMRILYGNKHAILILAVAQSLLLPGVN